MLLKTDGMADINLQELLSVTKLNKINTLLAKVLLHLFEEGLFLFLIKV